MRKLNRIVLSLLTVLFLGYYAGITLFPHAHEVNGRITIHSHPYSGNATSPQHSHTAQQAQLIDLLMQVTFFGLLFAGIAPILRRHVATLRPGSAAVSDAAFLELPRLRGPPRQ